MDGCAFQLSPNAPVQFPGRGRHLAEGDRAVLLLSQLIREA